MIVRNLGMKRRASSDDDNDSDTEGMLQNIL